MKKRLAVIFAAVMASVLAMGFLVAVVKNLSFFTLPMFKLSV